MYIQLETRWGIVKVNDTKSKGLKEVKFQVSENNT